MEEFYKDRLQESIDDFMDRENSILEEECVANFKIITHIIFSLFPTDKYSFTLCREYPKTLITIRFSELQERLSIRFTDLFNICSVITVSSDLIAETEIFYNVFEALPNICSWVRNRINK